MTPEEFFALYKQVYPLIKVYGENLDYPRLLRVANARADYKEGRLPGILDSVSNPAVDTGVVVAAVVPVPDKAESMFTKIKRMSGF